MSCTLKLFKNSPEENKENLKTRKRLLRRLGTIAKDNTDAQKIYDEVIKDRINIRWNLEDTKNPEFKQSIYDLIDFINQGIDEESNISESIKADLKQLVTKNLGDLAESKVSVTQVTEPDSPSIEGSEDMPNEQTRISLKLQEIENKFYSTNIKAATQRQIAFGKEILHSCIIDVKSKKSVSTLEDLNISICNLKNSYYKNIIQYLQSIDKNYTPEANNMFGPNTGKLDSKYIIPLNRFFNLLQEYKKNGELDSKITNGWYKSQTGETDLFYQALNSYVSLVYFDDCLKQMTDNVIKPLKGTEGQEVDRDYMKYDFYMGTDHKHKDHLNSENRDALKDISRYSKLLVNDIKIYTQTGYRGKHCNMGMFTNAMSILFKTVLTHNAFKPYPVLREILLNFHRNPTYYMRQMCLTIWDLKNNKPNKHFIEKAKEAKIPQNHIDTIQSIAKYALELGEIDTKDILTKGLSGTAYPKLGVLAGVVDRTMEASYLQSIYSSAVNMQQVSIKKKYTDTKSLYTVINNINNRLIRDLPETRTQRLDKYETKLYRNGTITIVTLLDTKYTDKDGVTRNVKVQVSVQTNGNAAIDRSGTLHFIVNDKSYKSTQANSVPILKGAFNDIELDSTKKVQDLLKDSQNDLSKQLFVNTIKFLDDYLHQGLYSENGLNILQIYKQGYTQQGTFLNAMLIDAIRASAIDKVYDDFNSDSTYGKDKLKFKDYINKYITPLNSYGQPKSDRISKGIFRSNAVGIPNIYLLGQSSAWIDNLNEAKAILTGSISRNTTKDINNNSIANNRTSFLGGNLNYYLYKYQKTEKANSGQAVTPLLFTRDSELVLNPVFNTDSINKFGIKKNVREMNLGELSYQSIIQNFYSNFYQPKWNGSDFNANKNPLAGTVLVQPTTYSDKVTFVTYPVKVNKELQIPDKPYNGKSIWELNTSELIDLFSETVGKAYENALNNVIADYIQIFGPQINTVEAINERLSTLSPEELLQLANKANVNLTLDTHYRTISIDGKTRCRLNETLVQQGTILKDPIKLAQVLEREKVNFINDLLTSHTVFYTTNFDDKGKSDESVNVIRNIIEELFPLSADRTKYYQQWVKNNKLIIAKVGNKEYVQGELIPEGSKVELNPLLEKYFYTDSLLANNLRLEITGSEIAHPDKSNIDIKDRLKAQGITPIQVPEIAKILPDGTYQFNDRVQDLVWLSEKIPTIKNKEVVRKIQNVVNKAIVEITNVAQGTQLKRNVIIPATLQYIQGDNIKGPRSKMNVAVIEDTQAFIYNFRGQSAHEDAHDGSAMQDIFTSILENNALLDQEVGVDKKPIWHHYDPRTMSATLLKFAVFTMTSERMRNFLKNNDINLYSIFKKMTDKAWKDENGNWTNEQHEAIDLTYSQALQKEIQFGIHILKGRKLYYEENGKHYQILDFKKDSNGNYYTIEAPATINGKVGDVARSQYRVYHFYNADSTHLKVKAAIDQEVTAPEGTHTINSLFQLYNALGGIYAEEISNSGELKYTDVAAYAVTDFINTVSFKRTNRKAYATFDQHEVYQPLKEMQINYVANHSAVKNGVININPSTSWIDSSKLRYASLDIDGLGIQMDADHTIDEAELTEFSQVISALEAGGRLHDRTKIVYKALGMLSVESSKLEIDAIAKYINAQKNNLPLTLIRSEIYDLLGRTLIDNYKPRAGYVDLAGSIVNELKRKFDLNTSHRLDELLAPFSDPSLYATVTTAFTSELNKKAIKRKYPGSGCVMVPAYHIVQHYKYDGKIYQVQDVLKQARRAQRKNQIYHDFDSSKESITDYNLGLIQAYLNIKQNEIEQTDSVNNFIPSDVVNVYIDGVLKDTITLNTLDIYYQFKGYNKLNPNPTEEEKEENIRMFLSGRLAAKNGDLTTTISPLQGKITYSMNVTQPRDLAPARISWEYQDNEGNIHFTNIFDTEEVRNTFLTDTKDRRAVQRVFDNLSKGIYHGYKVTNLHNEAAELVMSNLYASKFNLGNHSLAEALDNPNIFKVRRITQIDSDKYDIILSKNNGRNTYITLNAPKVDALDPKAPKYIGWKHTKLTWDSQRRRWDVIDLDKNHQELLKVGHYKWLKNYSVEGNNIKDEKGNILTDKEIRLKKLKIIDGDKVGKYFEHISRYNITEYTDNKKLIPFTVYYINRNAIELGYANNSKENFKQSFDESINKRISNIITDLYNIDNYNGIRFNINISEDTFKLIKETIPNIKVDTTLKQCLNNIINLYDKAFQEKKSMNDKNYAKEYNKILTDYYNIFAQELYSSFANSVYFISSRIPAQTLQSFMQMKLVSLSESEKNVAYVSHFQTWLQGSDYK